MIALRTVAFDALLFRLRHRQFGLGLCHVQFASITGVKAMLNQTQGILPQLDGLLQHIQF